MIYIIAVHLEYGDDHSSICFYRWIKFDNDEPKTSSLMEMIQFMEHNPHTVFVKDTQGESEVVIVNANPPYLRTQKDGRLTDNLLSLPRF